MVSGPMLFRVLTATVLPSRSAGASTSLPLGTTTESHASSWLVPPSTPWEMIWTGSFFEPAMISDVVFEKPIW
jgi:hypothetical protein